MHILKKLLFILLLLLPLNSFGLQLLYVGATWCPACLVIKNEILPFYNDVDLPIVQIDITTGIIANEEYRTYYGNGTIARLYGIPAFIIWDEVNKRELVRWVGYASKEHFYDMLNRAKLIAERNIERCKIFNICLPNNIE